MFLRIKNIPSTNKNKRYPYLYLCENQWIKGQNTARQKVVLYLGRVDIGTLDLSNIKFDECKYCHSKENLVIDHIVPLASTGTNDIQNIQVLCTSCNTKKGKK